MWEFVCVLASFFTMVLSQGGYNTQGDGIWSIINIEPCEKEIEDPIMTFDVERQKINHTHEMLRSVIGATMEIDDTFKLYVVVCKHVDGGCKHYATVVDGLAKLVNKHAKKNLENAFKCAGLDQKDFPIPEGTHVVENFIMDYCELPTYCPYGLFEAEAFILKDEQQVGCLKVVVKFTEQEEDICT